MRILLLLMAVVVLMAGCAAKNYTSDPSKSTAYNICGAAGIKSGKYDVPVAAVGGGANKPEGSTDLELFGNAKYDKPITASEVGNIVGAVAFGILSAFDPLPGFGSTGTGIMSGVAGLTVGKSGNVENYSRCFAWMPKGMAASDDEAYIEFVSILKVAQHSALQDMNIHERRNKEFHNTEGIASSFGIQLVDGHCCNEFDCRLFFAFGKNHYKPFVEKAPREIGAYESWSWTFMHVNHFFAEGYCSELKDGKLNLEKDHKTCDDVNQALFRFAVMKYLPNWVFMFAPPGILKTPDGRVNKVPVVLQGGGDSGEVKIHYFVKPEPVADSGTKD